MRVWGPEVKVAGQRGSMKVHFTDLVLSKLSMPNVWKQRGIWSIRCCTGELPNVVSIFSNFIRPSEMSQTQTSLITPANQCVPASHSLCPCVFSLPTLTSLYNIWHVFEFKRPSGDSSFSMLIHPFAFFHPFCISLLIRTVGGPSSLCSPRNLPRPRRLQYSSQSAEYMNGN